MARRSRTPLRRTLRLLLLTSLGVLLLAYPLDWMIWRVEMLFDRGMGSAQVTQTTAATLKGDRFEVYGGQTATVNCSRSLLPEAGAGPCWWIRQHPQNVTQY